MTEKGTYNKTSPTDKDLDKIRLLKDFETIIENASVGIVVMQDNRFSFANPTIANWLGMTVDEMIGMEYEQVIFPDDRATVRENYRQRMLTGVATPIYPYRIWDKDNNIKWVQLEASKTTWGGKPAVLGFLTDITLRKQYENILNTQKEEVHSVLIGALHALSSALEKRDPYTAGHQFRVANLCKAIGEKIDLPSEQILALYLAASVHDIGKIYIPSEILNRPGKLSAIEFEMIKTHSQVGYEILDTIKFEYPIARFVLQHHERMDGSGYPSRLKGAEISIEARIMGVADVMEAMSSHRPYRPALGTIEAMKEIRRHRGSLFDTDVTDICLDLFSEGYQFPSAKPEYFDKEANSKV